MSGPIRHNFPSGNQDQFNVRFPEGMRDRIKAAADQNGRSMNAEIVATLAEKYPAAAVDVQAVESLLHYIASGKDAAQKRNRLDEVNKRFANAGSPLKVDMGPDDRLSILTDF